MLGLEHQARLSPLLHLVAGMEKGSGLTLHNLQKGREAHADCYLVLESGLENPIFDVKDYSPGITVLHEREKEHEAERDHSFCTITDMGKLHRFLTIRLFETHLMEVLGARGLPNTRSSPNGDVNCQHGHQVHILTRATLLRPVVPPVSRIVVFTSVHNIEVLRLPQPGHIGDRHRC